ncbi:hypothetical protein [Lactiplantibacillus plantarum]|uniref:hypothetical protein n=1 Tax=Lactiplantibacillus plantarum TaxID=1590 RepID=UPI00345E56D0
MTKNSIYRELLIILLVLQVYFFDIIPALNQALTNWNTDVSKKLEVIVLFCILFVRMIPEKDSFNKELIKLHFNLLSISILVGTIVVAVGSAIIYHQTFITGISGFYGFLIIPLGYWALAPFFERYDNVVWFYKMCVIFCSVYLFLQFGQALIYKISGSIFLQYTQSALQNVYSLGRFTESIDFITFVSIFVSVKPFLIGEKWSKSEITLILLIIMYHAFISMGRMYLLITVSVFCLAVLFLQKKLISSITLTAFLIGIMYFLPTLIERIFSIFTEGSRASSYTIRTYGIDYYYNHIFFNGWFGMGFPDPGIYNWLLHGAIGFDLGAGLMNYADLGLLGTSAILGMVGLIIIIYLIVLMVISIVRGQNKKALWILNLGIFGEFFTLSPFDMQRAWLFSLTLLLIDFTWNNTRRNLLAK